MIAAGRVTSAKTVRIDRGQQCVTKIFARIVHAMHATAAISPRSHAIRGMTQMYDINVMIHPSTDNVSLRARPLDSP